MRDCQYCAGAADYPGGVESERPALLPGRHLQPGGGAALLLPPPRLHPRLAGRLPGQLHTRLSVRGG